LIRYHKILNNKYRNTSGADGNRLLSDSSVGNDVTRGLCGYTTILNFMKRINKQNNVNNTVKNTTLAPVSSPVNVSFTYQVI